MSDQHELRPEHHESLVEYIRFQRRKRDTCVAEVAASSIDNGALDKVKCPGMLEFTTPQRACTTCITELDLKMMGVS